MTRSASLISLLALGMTSLLPLAAKAQQPETIQAINHVPAPRAQMGQATYVATSAPPRHRGAMGGGLIEALFGGAEVQAPYGAPSQPRRIIMAPPQSSYVNEPSTGLPSSIEQNRIEYPAHRALAAHPQLSGASIRTVPRYQRPQAAVPLVSSRISEPQLAIAVREEFSEPRGGIDPRFLPQNVAYDGPHGAGTIVINTSDKYLYLVEGNGQARRYGVGVGRPGFSWKGVKHITRKAEWPDWRPPNEMLKRRPDLPRFMAGGPNNPLGARAMYLGSTMYRIHGSNEPHTIGQAVSSGCFRMRNEDVIDLYNRVKVGTKVIIG